MAGASAFLLAGYEFVRSASNTLYKAAYGADRLPIVMAIMPVGVLIAVWVYGRLLSRMGPRKTLWWTSIGWAFLIAAATIAVQQGFKPATAVLYIFREAYIVVIIEQYWSFLDSSLGQEQARKLNGPICGIASLGAIGGGILVGQLAQAIGTAMMPLFAAGLLLPAALVADVGYKIGGEPTPIDRSKPKSQLGLNQFSASPLLIVLLAIIVCTQIVSAGLDLRFQDLLQVAYPDPDRQTAFSGSFFAGLNAAAAVMQFAVTPLLLRLLPVNWIHIAIPAVHVTACCSLIAAPSLGTAGAAYLIFKCIDYSIFRASKEILYIPLPFDARYRAKELIDVFGYRAGKGGISVTFAAASALRGINLAGLYAPVACAASLVWIMLSIPLTRLYRQSMANSNAESN